MPKVEIRITRDLSYGTRRLKAGDTMTVPERDARVLVGIRKAEYPRQAGRVAPPPREVVERAAAATPTRTTPASAKPVSAMTSEASPKRTTRRRRKSAAKKG